MSGEDDLSSLGGKITDVFVKTFASADPSAGLVFLTLGVSPPKELVQHKSESDPTLVINPAQMAAFLAQHFDEPYLVSPERYGLGSRDGYYGRFSQIYPLAISLAQPSAPVGTPAWKLVNSEIAASQAALTPAGMAYSMGCIPDDWPLPSNSAYWSIFDSTQIQSPPPAPAKQTTAPTPDVRLTSLWTFRAPLTAVAPAHNLDEIHAANPPQPISAKTVAEARVSPNIGVMAMNRNVALAAHPAPPPPHVAPSMVRMSNVALPDTPAPPPPHAAPSMVRMSNVALPATPAPPPPRVAPSMVRINPQILVHPIEPRPGWPPPHPIQPTPAPPPPPPATPPPPPAPSASVSMHFEYMSTDIGYFNAGVSMWNAMFVANPDWSVPGMTRGGLLPAPHTGAASGEPAPAYGLPIALILVRNLNISIKWSGQAPSGFDNANGGAIGPFSLAGASISSLPDGTWSCSQPGVQVVAVICRRLPVLPPRDDPSTAVAVASNTSSGPVPASSASGTAPSSAPAIGASTPSSDNGGASRAGPATGDTK